MTNNIYTVDNFELLYSELPIGAAIFSKEGNVLYVNKFLLAMTGYSESSFKKMNITTFASLSLMEFKTEEPINLPHKQGGDFPATCTYIPLNEDYYALFAEKIIDISKLNINNLTDLDKYKMFLDLTDSIILLIDSHGRVRYINKTGCDIIGYKKEFILGKEWIKHFVPKEYADYVTECLKDAMSQQGPIELHSQNPVLTISGETRIIKWKDIKIFDEHNKISGTLSSGTDVTEQVKNEIRFNFSDEIAQMGNWSKNLITDEYAFSDGFYRLIGYKPGEIKLTLPFVFKAVHPDDSEITQKTILESYRTNIGYNFIFRIIRTDGEIRYIKAASLFQKDTSGTPIMSFGTVIDITEIMESRIELTEARDSLMLAEEIANIGSYIRDMETNLYICSNGFFKILGLKKYRNPMEYWEVISFTHPEDLELVKNNIESSIGNSDTFDFENRIIRTTGEVRYIRSRGLHIRDTNGKISKVLGTLLDITDYKMTEGRLKDNIKRIEQVEHIASIGFWERNFKTGEYSCSDGFCNVCGLDPKTFKPTYETMSETVHVDDRESVKEIFNNSEKSGSDFLFTHRIVKPDGSIKFVRSQGHYQKDEKEQLSKVIGTIIDVTEYIEKENKLLESQKMLEMAEGLAQIGRWEWDITNDSYNASDGHYNITEIQPENTILNASAMSEAVHPDDLEMVLKIIRESLEKGTDFSFNHKFLTRNNHLKHVKTRGTCIKDESGKPIKIIGTIIDITDYIEATKNLKENEKRLEDAELLAGIGHWEWNLETDEHYMSKGLLNIFGYKSILDIPAGGNLKNIYHKKDSGRVAKLIQDAINNKNDDYYYEAMIVRPGGEIRNVAVSGILIKNQNGEVIKTKGTYSDITRIKEYQHKIRENEIRMRSAEEAANIGSWERDLRTGVYVCSPGVFKIMGKETSGGFLSYEEQLSIVHPDDRDNVNSIIEEALRNQSDYELNHRIIRLDGQVRHINVKATLLKDSDGTPIKVYGTVIDVTDEKKRQEERLLIESQLRNQQKLESIGILAGGVAHEINNPINGIMNYGQLILDETKGDSDLRTYATEIIKETERVADIVRNLLKFSRKDQSYYSRQSVLEIIENTTSLINTILKKDQITLNINIPSNLPLINCNGQQIQQVIMNLITNARDSLNEKYPAFNKNKTISISGTSIERNSGRFVQLKIEDSGTGIPENVRDNVFDPFFTTKQPGQGTGLGLSISYRIIEEHGGNLYFTSETDKFTRFFIELPVDSNQ